MVPALPTRDAARGYSSGMPPIRVVLAEDGDLLRAGVLALLSGFDAIDVVAPATDLPELLAVVDEHRPDVLLTDIRMPPDFTDEGIRAASELRRTHPGLGVGALTQYSDVEYALDLVRDGRDGHRPVAHQVFGPFGTEGAGVAAQGHAEVALKLAVKL